MRSLFIWNLNLEKCENRRIIKKIWKKLPIDYKKTLIFDLIIGKKWNIICPYNLQKIIFYLDYRYLLKGELYAERKGQCCYYQTKKRNETK